jgi:hypothetical protein
MSTRRPALKVGDKVVNFLMPEMYARADHVIMHGPYTLVKRDYMYPNGWTIESEGRRKSSGLAFEENLYIYDKDILDQYITGEDDFKSTFKIPRKVLNTLDIHAAMLKKRRNQVLREEWEKTTDTLSEPGMGPLNKIKQFTGNIGVKPTDGPTPYMLNMMKRFEVVRTRKQRKSRKQRKQRKSRKHA